MPFFMGSVFVRFRNYLNEIYLYQIHPQSDINTLLINILEDYYIQPLYKIFKDYLEDITGHQVSIGGNGFRTTIKYEDTEALFQFEVSENFAGDTELYYNRFTTNNEAIDLIHYIEFIYATYPTFNIGEIAENNKQEQDKKRRELIDKYLADGFDITENIEDYDIELPE